jgi:hypothetical protein
MPEPISWHEIITRFYHIGISTCCTLTNWNLHISAGSFSAFIFESLNFVKRRNAIENFALLSIESRSPARDFYPLGRKVRRFPQDARADMKPNMRQCMSVLLVLSLAGCFDQQEAQLAKCKRETQPIGYPYDMTGFNADLMDNCMSMAGYRFDISHKDCELRPGIPLRVNAYCYVPAGPVQYWLYRAEMMLHSN